MREPVIKIERVRVEQKIQQLCELIEKQNPHDMTQHLRGQLMAWRAVQRWNDPPPVLKQPDEQPVGIY